LRAAEQSGWASDTEQSQLDVSRLAKGVAQLIETKKRSIVQALKTGRHLKVQLSTLSHGLASSVGSERFRCSTRSGPPQSITLSCRDCPKSVSGSGSIERVCMSVASAVSPRMLDVPSPQLIMNLSPFSVCHAKVFFLKSAHSNTLLCTAGANMLHCVIIYMETRQNR
jgi:hypothetical protein